MRISHAAPTAEGPPAQRSWQVWGLAASVVVTSPVALEEAVSLARCVLDGVDLACSRFRPDSELALRRRELATGAKVTPLLASLVDAALEAARWTGGAVDPTLGNDLISLGYDRDFSRLQSAGTAPFLAALPHRLLERSTPGWRSITLDGTFLTVPADVTLDLGATAKAVAADMAAARIAVELGCGVLVNLGGDIATAGPAPEDGSGPAGHWQIMVQDTPADPAQQVSLPAGHALATSSTLKRRWRQDGALRHHILDPRFGLPVETVWRSASVAAATALEANAYSTAALVKGHAAPGWLRGRGVSSRLVDQQGRTLTTMTWPAAGLPWVLSHG
ncbi:FAD:protein FMN transferase [Arthrobacter sp. LAPM80]|uniref:FAD:protein FMN transferase n=1 Tax=Arthrobacter sp. LAPM80 TaxID=3141788 RepID=UPI00398BA41B